MTAMKGTRSAGLAWRFLLPAVSAVLLLVVFPMLYTVSLSFTNASSTNLMTQAQALERLLGEQRLVEDSRRPFELEHLATASVPTWRLRSGAWASPPFSAPPGTPLAAQAAQEGDMATRVALLPSLRGLRWPQAEGPPLQLLSLRELAAFEARFSLRKTPNGPGLLDTASGRLYGPDLATGYFTHADGERLVPGFQVGVGLQHYQRLVSEPTFREPFLAVLIWTVVFSALTVVLAAGLGLVLAALLQWDELGGRGLYRTVLFLPYAVPAFISILVFKGLFNQNLGEVNAVLHALFGLRPAWFSDPWLARAMLVAVNVWLGFPYMMLLCAGLLKTIPADLYEASALAGAAPWHNFWRITVPLVMKPLGPLLVAAFAFNFNNFVLVSLLTGGRPDQLDSALPVGTTDILVSYTWRIAFQDSSQQFGLAAAISTVIFAVVAGITLVQLRMSTPQPRRAP